MHIWLDRCGDIPAASRLGGMTMSDAVKLMCILAHRDDESNGFGGTLARYAAEGVETYLLTATRGESKGGWRADPKDFPGLEAFGRMREAELRVSAAILGVREFCLLDYIDGDLDQANPVEAIAQIVAHIRRVRPQVVLTFGLDGAYGHPDHIAISQFTTAALVAAADPSYAGAGPTHRVSKLYHRVNTQALGDLYQTFFGEIVMPVDGIDRLMVAWPDWAVNAWIRAGDYGEIVQQAM